MSFLQSVRPYQYFIWLFLVLVTAFAIYTPSHFVFKQLARFGVQIMFGSLLLGMLFLMRRDAHSMWVSLACCGMLCLNLRTREPFYPIQYGISFKIAHVNLSNSNDYEATIEAILKSRADVISLQDLDPNWDYILKERLKAVYPYEKTLITLGVYNPAIYSKYPFTEIDTFHFKDVPNIHGCVKIDKKSVHFISSMTMPPIDTDAYTEIGQHLQAVGTFAARLNAPVLTLGDYNVVMHSNELIKLKNRGGLKDSRRDYSPILQTPFDHILYSHHLECTNFVGINELKGNRIGIMGTYQFNRNE
jgi:endonuclease/exonuclease/phosphatase (EEP) superfamily protein YafD